MAARKSHPRPGAPEAVKHVHENGTSGDLLRAPNETPAPIPERVLHVNGKPIPEEYAHLIHFAQTDEGIAEANSRRAEPSGIEMVRDAWDNNLARGADEGTPSEVWEEINPLTAAVARATGGRPDGFAYKLMSKTICDKKGTRGFVGAKDAKSGEQIRVGNMFLGRMPESKRNMRNEHYRKLGIEQLEQVEQAYAADQDSSIRSSGSEGVSTLRSGDALSDHRDPDVRIESIGVRASTRP